MKMTYVFLRMVLSYTKFFKADVENKAIVPITDWIRYVKE